MRILCIPAIALLASCGLPGNILFLSPIEPLKINNLTTADRGFRHSPENNYDEFLGYDIYYKLYATDTEDALTNDASAINDYDQPYTAVLDSRGFKKTAIADWNDTQEDFENEINPSDDIPIIGDNYSDESYTVELSKFTGTGRRIKIQLTRANGTNAWEEYGKVLLRPLDTTANGYINIYKSFVDDYTVDDVDVKTMMSNPNSVDNVYVLFAAIPKASSPETGELHGPPKIISDPPTGLSVK